MFCFVCLLISKRREGREGRQRCQHESDGRGNATKKEKQNETNKKTQPLVFLSTTDSHYDDARCCVIGWCLRSCDGSWSGVQLHISTRPLYPQPGGVSFDQEYLRSIASKYASFPPYMRIYKKEKKKRFHKRRKGIKKTQSAHI